MAKHMKLKKAGGALLLLAGLHLAYGADAATGNGAGAQGGAAGTNAVKVSDAKHNADPAHAMILSATHAGNRIVAVGEQGVILLSDDNGAHFRQALHVPANATLTSVSFADAQHGWAAGHWGVVLRTDDGGEHWRLQRSDTSVDQPLFSIAFRDAKHGWAVGLWSLLLTTSDGGETWVAQSVDKSAGAGKSGLNFFAVFAGTQGDVYIAAEQGTVFKSTDDGATWQTLHTGYKGSLWSGVVAADHTVYVGGLRGNLFASHDGGASWQRMASGVEGSITDLIADPQGVTGVALDGYVTQQKTGQDTFVAKQLPGRDALSALVVNGDGSSVLFSKDGVIAR